MIRLLIALVLAGGAGYGVGDAVASSSTPFSFEYSQRFSDVYVMRVRDTTEGVVCYLARSPGIAAEPQASISCVRAAP